MGEVVSQRTSRRWVRRRTTVRHVEWRGFDTLSGVTELKLDTLCADHLGGRLRTFQLPRKSIKRGK